jgi:hypothetical protein
MLPDELIAQLDGEFVCREQQVRRPCMPCVVAIPNISHTHANKPRRIFPPRRWSTSTG